MGADRASRWHRSGNGRRNNGRRCPAADRWLRRRRWPGGRSAPAAGLGASNWRRIVRFRCIVRFGGAECRAEHTATATHEPAEIGAIRRTDSTEDHGRRFPNRGIEAFGSSTYADDRRSHSGLVQGLSAAGIGWCGRSAAGSRRSTDSSCRPTSRTYGAATGRSDSGCDVAAGRTSAACANRTSSTPAAGPDCATCAAADHAA